MPAGRLLPIGIPCLEHASISADWLFILVRPGLLEHSVYKHALSDDLRSRLHLVCKIILRIGDDSAQIQPSFLLRPNFQSMISKIVLVIDASVSFLWNGSSLSSSHCRSSSGYAIQRGCGTVLGNARQVLVHTTVSSKGDPARARAALGTLLRNGIIRTNITIKVGIRAFRASFQHRAILLLQRLVSVLLLGHFDVDLPHILVFALFIYRLWHRRDALVKSVLIQEEGMLLRKFYFLTSLTTSDNNR